MAETSSDQVRAPPTQLSTPNIEEIDQGSVLHRVHDQQFPGNEFNPCIGGQTRFAPIYDQVGYCIPSLYAAETVEAAIY